MAAVPPGDGVVLGGEGGELGLSLRQRALRRLTLGDEFSQHTGCRGCDIECLVEGFMVIQTSL